MQKFPCPNHEMKLHRLHEETMLQSKMFRRFPIHAVNLLVPNLIQPFRNISDILVGMESTYFIVKGISAAALIEIDFLEKFVSKGQVWATAQNLNAETDNFIAITPNAKLILSLETEIAHSLSLVKERILHKNKKHIPSHKTIIIELVQFDFYPGKKHYEYILRELQKLDYLKFDLLMKWTPKGNVCPQSLQAYFETQHLECIPCETNYVCRTAFSVPTPKIDFSLMDESMAEDLLEWISMKICGIEYAEEEDTYVNRLKTPDPCQIAHKLQVESFEGFFTADQIVNALKLIRIQQKENPEIPFVAVLINGYQDCYVNYGEHGMFCGDEKVICVIMTPSSDCFIITLNVR